jgi:hypothetical protein
MKRPAKCRHQLYLDASKSAILADAVQAWLTKRGTHELDDRFGLRLDRISAQLGRLERDEQIVMESLALFIRFFLTINAPLPEPEQAARAVGRDRFKAFIDQVGRNLAGGTRTLGRADPDSGPGGERR